MKLADVRVGEHYAVSYDRRITPKTIASSRRLYKVKCLGFERPSGAGRRMVRIRNVDRDLPQFVSRWHGTPPEHQLDSRYLFTADRDLEQLLPASALLVAWDQLQAIARVARAFEKENRRRKSEADDRAAALERELYSLGVKRRCDVYARRQPGTEAQYRLQGNLVLSEEQLQVLAGALRTRMGLT